VCSLWAAGSDSCGFPVAVHWRFCYVSIICWISYGKTILILLRWTDTRRRHARPRHYRATDTMISDMRQVAVSSLIRDHALIYFKLCMKKATEAAGVGLHWLADSFPYIRYHRDINVAICVNTEAFEKLQLGSLYGAYLNCVYRAYCSLLKWFFAGEK